MNNSSIETCADVDEFHCFDVLYTQATSKREEGIGSYYSTPNETLDLGGFDPISASDDFVNNEIYNNRVEGDLDYFDHIEPRKDNLIPDHPLPINKPLRGKNPCPKKRIPNPLLHMKDTESKMKKPKKYNNSMRRKYPKKEYYREKLIRNYKKSNRNKKLTTTNCFTIEDELNDDRISDENPESREAVRAYTDYAETYYDALKAYSLTETGPLTEGKSKREKNNSIAKSFNNTYCKEFIQNPIVKQGFELYIKAIYTGKSCEELCKYFQFRCCDNIVHDEICKQKWLNVEIYSYTNLIE